MKRRVQLMILMVGGYAFSQAGIGIPLSTEPAQLEIVFSSKGLLIVRMVLTSPMAFSLESTSTVSDNLTYGMPLR